MKFKAVVDDPVMLNGKVVIPRGAGAMLQAVQVQQSGTMKGSDKITLKMNTLTIGGRVYEVASQYAKPRAREKARRRRARLAEESASER